MTDAPRRAATPLLVAALAVAASLLLAAWMGTLGDDRLPGEMRDIAALTRSAGEEGENGGVHGVLLEEKEAAAGE